MNRLKIAAPVDTTAPPPPPWVGKRIASWWRGSTAALIGSALFLVLCFALAIWAVLDPPAPVPTDADRQPITAAPVDPATDALPAPSVNCPSQGPVEDILPEQLIEQTYITDWYPVGTMAAPRSAAAGPADARQCFTRTPEGALYAVSTQLAEQVASVGILGVHFSGYQWRSFTGDQAVLLLRMQVESSVETQYLARAFIATWTGTDWSAEPDTSDAAIKSAEDPLRAFVPWGDS